MKPLSIQLYTVRELTKDGNHMAVLEKIAKIGYKGVEGHGYGMTPREFRTAMANLGMEVSSYFGPTPTPETVNEFIDTAKELGVKNTVSGFWVESFANTESILKTAEAVNTVLPRIHAAGLTFSLHNHWFEFYQVDGRLAIDILVEHAPAVGLELDIYWASAFGANKAEEMVAKFRDRVHLMHVKDGPLVEGEPMVAAGQGKVNIPAAVAAADSTVLDWLIVELDEYAGDMMEAVESSYRYLTSEGLAAGNV